MKAQENVVIILKHFFIWNSRGHKNVDGLSSSSGSEIHLELNWFERLVGEMLQITRKYY